MKIPVGLDHRVLHDVGSLVADQGVGDAQRQRLMACHERTERVEVTVLRAFDKFVVAKCGRVVGAHSLL